MGWEVRNLTIIPSQQSKLELLTPPHIGVGIDGVYGPRNTMIHYSGCTLPSGKNPEGRKEKGETSQDGSTRRFQGDDRRARSSHRGL